jgi:hypothetical protein
MQDRFTDSKNGRTNSGQGSNTGSRNNVLRSLKDFVGATIRMLDRTALRTCESALRCAETFAPVLSCGCACLQT